MKKTLILILLSLNISAFSQNITVSGYVYDKQTGETLPGANIYTKSHKFTAISNSYGYYCLTVSGIGDSVGVFASYVGYGIEKTKFIKITSKNIKYNFLLTGGIDIDEVVISETDINRKSEINTVSISMGQIKKMPFLAGEKDVLKALQFLPGVSGGAEGTSGIFVRGGTPDQNLILLDDVSLYYVNHAGGYFSVFDENSISDVKLIKGGFPARYGGRLSSVLDIKMKNGNVYKYKGVISLGILSSKFSVEGPIQKGKASFFLSARRCNIDLFTRVLLAFKHDVASAGYTFYDVNLKINKKFSDKNRLFFSFYYGDDVMFLNADAQKSKQYNSNQKFKFGWENRWGNMLSSLRYNRVVGSHLFANTSISFLKYRYKYDSKLQRTDNTGIVYENNNSYGSGIFDITGKINFDYYASSFYKITFGTSLIYHIFQPGEYKSYLFQNKKETKQENFQTKLYTYETNIYIENEFKISDIIELNAGLHFSSYFINEKSFISPEPRININFLPLRNTIINLSYSRMKQYVHLLSNSNIGMAYDMWLPATHVANPENAEQFSAGINQKFSKNKFSISISVFHKTSDNLIDFKEGASFIDASTDWQQRIETDGKGKSYGLEFLARKNKGKITGWFSYTLSRNIRRFSKLNFGNEFLYRYDRPHNFSIVAQYQLSKKIDFSANWIYSSGELMTLGASKYVIPVEYFENMGYDIAYNYSSKNNYRLPAYHRLDIALNLTKIKPRGKAVWSFGIYNVYNQKNTYMLYPDTDSSGKVKIYKLTLFPIIPSISYRFYFE